MNSSGDAGPEPTALESKTALHLRRFTSVELLGALVLLIISFPFVEKLDYGELIISILFTFVLIFGIRATVGRGIVLVISAILAVPPLIGRWANEYRPELVPSHVFLIGGIIFVVFVVINLLRFLLRARSVTTDVLCSGISAYLMLGLLWTLAYWLVAELDPKAFSFNIASAGDTSMKGFNSVYFSFITLSTVGYGDITPVATSVRMLAATEAITGLLYISVLIARLVAIHAMPKSNKG